MVTKADFDRSNWQDILSNASSMTCDSYYSAFKQAWSDATDNEDEDTDVAEVFRFIGKITSMWLDPSQSADDPFFPMMIFTDGSRTPTVEDLNSEELEILAQVVNDISDPELRARIADILWIRKRDYRMAILAARAYVESTKRLKKSDAWLSPVSWRLERAIQLARQIRNTELIGEIFSNVEGIAQKAVSDGQLLNFAPITMMNLMQKYNYIPDDNSAYISLAERGANAAANDRKWHLAREYWETKARWYSETDAEFRQARIEAAETYVKEAEVAAGDNPSRHIAAAAFIEDAIEALRKIGGMQERIGQLQVLLTEYGRKSLDEMGEISIPIDLTRASTKAKEQVQGKTLYDAMFVLMRLGNSPRVVDLREEVIRSIEAHPFTFRVASRTLNDLGKVVGRRGTVDDDEEIVIEYEMYQSAARSQDILAVGIIDPARQQILLEHRVRVRDFFPLVFDNPFIPPGREEIYARGLHAGLMGDHLIASHLLIPQIENSLRYVLQQNGVITDRLSHDLIQDEYTLDKIIYYDELKETFGDDIVFDLKGLLVKRSGSNIRNLLAHGLMIQDDFYSARLIYLWWLTLRLWGLPKLDFLLNLDEGNEDRDTQT